MQRDQHIENLDIQFINIFDEGKSMTMRKTRISKATLNAKTNILFRPIALTILTLLLLFLGNGTLAQQIIGYGFLFLGLVIVGIPHGAVDHLVETGKWNTINTPRYIFNYLFQAALMGIVWYLYPPVALLIFLGYSCLHFGETDGKQWNFSSLISFLWGFSVLFYILGTHLQETNSITSSIGNLTLPISCPVWALFPWLIWSLLRKQFSLAITVLWLSLSSQLPLLFAFGLYFIGQHSITSWKHITANINLRNEKIWLKSFPFHAGAWMLLLLFILFWPSSKSASDLTQWGPFFIFIACISLPHAVSMHSMYQKKLPKQSQKVNC